MAKMTPTDWIEEIDRALEYREHYGREVAWRKNEQNYMNLPNSHAARGPNLVFEMGDILLSATGSLDPEITVVPEHPAGLARAPIVESVDNLLVRKMKLRKWVNRSNTHAYLYGRAILKLGFDSEYGYDPSLDIGAGNLMGMTLSQFHRKSGERIEFKDVSPGMPWVSSVLPHDFVVPWGTIDLDDSPWCAFRFIRLNRHLKEDRKYKNTTGLHPNMSIEDFVQSYMSVSSRRTRYREFGHRDTGIERPKAVYNECWEIHDRETGTIKVVTRDHDKYLRDTPSAILAVCGFPFITGTFVEHPRSFWSTPLAYYLGQLQSESFDIARQSEKQRRISILKFIAAKGFMSEEKLQRLISGDVGALEFAEVMDGLRDKIIQMPTGQMYDFIVQSNNVRQNARSMIGFSRNQAGEFDTGTRRTKGEAMLVAQGSLRREGPRVQMVRDLYLESVTKVNKMIFSFWTMPRVAQVGREWPRFTGEEIKGDYLYDLSLAAKRDLSKAERKVEAMMMLAQLGPILQSIDPQMIMQYLSDAANDPAFERLLGLNKGRQPNAQQQMTGEEA